MTPLLSAAFEDMTPTAEDLAGEENHIVDVSGRIECIFDPVRFGVVEPAKRTHLNQLFKRKPIAEFRSYRRFPQPVSSEHRSRCNRLPRAVVCLGCNQTLLTHPFSADRKGEVGRRTEKRK